MKNIVRIIVSGAIATILQKSIGLNPISLEGFGFFMAVFLIVSFSWHFISSKKDDNEENIENLKLKNKRSNKYIFSLIKKIAISIITLIVLNTSINFISFKLGVFDDEFKYRNDTSIAIALDLNEKAQTSFKIDDFTYFLYKHKEKYFLVKQKSSLAKQKVLTLYSKIYMFHIFRNLKDEDNFEDILKKISPIVYEEVTLKQMIFYPLYLSNSISHIYWSSDDFKKYKTKYEEYQQKKIDIQKQKELELEEKKYNKLLNQNTDNMTEKEIGSMIKELYTIHAFTRDTRHILNLFSILDKKQKNKKKELKLFVYQFRLMSYLQLFRQKEKLNNILKKYNFGVVYTFNFWKGKPMDIKEQKYSHLRLVDLKNHKRFLLSHNDIKSIEVKHDTLAIHFHQKKDLIFDNFKSKDKEYIKNKLLSMIKNINFIETEFYKNKKKTI